MVKLPGRGRFPALLFLIVVSCGALGFAGDYLFISIPYLQQTKQVVAEADVQAHVLFAEGTPFAEKYSAVRASLLDQIDSIQRTRLQKKVKAEVTSDLKDKAFADTLNSFKDAINLMARQSNRSLTELLPSYARWSALETQVVKAGLDKRLAAFETRFGPESEPINVIELLVGEKFLPGDESGPSPWEPILRLTAVQLTSSGSGVTSSIEVGTNFYFVKKAAPKPLQLLGISNHIGVAAVLQYLEDPSIFNFSGQPAYGVMFHLGRKEAGVVYDAAARQWSLSLGYSFQFIPFVI